MPQARGQERRKPEEPAQVVWQPLGPAELRACPSCVLRSALFGGVQRGRRKALERAILATGVECLF